MSTCIHTFRGKNQVTRKLSRRNILPAKISRSMVVALKLKLYEGVNGLMCMHGFHSPVSINDCTESHSIIPATAKVGDVHFLISMNATETLTHQTWIKINVFFSIIPSSNLFHFPFYSLFPFSQFVLVFFAPQVTHYLINCTN